jgi:hypothetical protein
MLRTGTYTYLLYSISKEERQKDSMLLVIRTSNLLDEASEYKERKVIAWGQLCREITKAEPDQSVSKRLLTLCSV